MRERWRQSSIAEICDIVSGQHILSGDYNTDGVGIGYLTGPSDFGPVFPIVTKWTTVPKATARDGDILVTVKGSGVGSVNLWRGDEVAISRQLMAIRPNVADPWFVFRWMQLNTPHLCSIATGAAIPGLSKSQIGSLRIPLPPLAEQKRIVAILDEAFEAIERAEDTLAQQMTAASLLFDSALQHYLGIAASRPTSSTLSDITECIVDCEHKTAPLAESGFPSIRTPNIGKGHLILDDVNLVDEATYRQWTRRETPRPGDLILAREAPAGNVGVIPKGEMVCLGQRTVLIRPNTDMIDPHFLAYLLLTPFIQDRLLSHSTGTTVEHVNLRDIRALKLPSLPSVAEQQAVVGAVRDIQQMLVRLQAVQDKKRGRLKDLRQALLAAGFRGELSVSRERSGPRLAEAIV